MDVLLGVFSLAKLQELLVLNDHLIANGKTIEDVRIHIVALKEAVVAKSERSKRLSNLTKPCLDCGSEMKLSGSEEEAQWYCKKCGKGEYVELSQIT